MYVETGLFSNEIKCIARQANFPDDPLDKKFQFNVWYHKWKLGMFLNTDMHFFYDIEGSNMLNGTRCRPSGADYGHSGDVLSKQCGKGPWGNVSVHSNIFLKDYSSWIFCLKHLENCDSSNKNKDARL